MVPPKNFLQLEIILRELQSCLISHWGSWRSFSSLVFVLCFFCGLVVGSFYINTANFTGCGHLYLFHVVPIFVLLTYVNYIGKTCHLFRISSKLPTQRSSSLP